MTKVLAIGVLFGCLAGSVLTGFAVFAQGQETKSSYSYRVIDENDGEKIERDLNSLTRSNPSCRPILAIAPNEYGKAKVILECEN